ncbi:MAG: YihY family inner membrane protein [Gammaproteobacteria bacterium]|nr:YihY family inner membrane protein [Gammaproteobacteria bacterium]
MKSVRDTLVDVLGFIRYIWHEFGEDGCQQAAALLTYQTLFAVVPFFTLLFLLFSKIPMFSGFELMIQNFLFAHVIPESVSGLQTHLNAFLVQAANLGTASITLLIIMAVLILTTIEKSFNRIWRIEKPRHRGIRLLIYLSVLVLAPLFIGLGMAVSTYLFSLPLFEKFATVVEPAGVVSWVPFMFGLLAFTLIYYGVPNCSVPFAHALAGAFVAALLFEVLKYLFVMLLAKSALQIIYGTFAAVPLLLIWINLGWMIILLGAEWAKALSSYTSASKKNTGIIQP